MPPALAPWTLRASLAACFVGHGAVALTGNPAWLAFFEPFGIGAEAARLLLPAVGILDLMVAAGLLGRPCRALYAWAALWTLFTALLRPLAGGSVLDVVVRAANWGPPLALLALTHGAGWWQAPRAAATSASNRRGALALLVLAVACIGVGLAAQGGVGPVAAPTSVVDLFKLLERAGIVGAPLALAALLASRPGEPARDQTG